MPRIRVEHTTPHAADPAHWAQAALDASPNEIAVLDSNGIIVATNRAWRKFAHERGVPPGRTGIGVNYLSVLDRAIDAGESSVRPVAEGIREVLTGAATTYRTDYRLDFGADAAWFQMDAVHIPAGGAIVSHQDISWRKNLEQRLLHQATHDPLTGLPNRILVEDRIDMAIQRAERQHRPVAVMFCDVDRFKDINDTYGHSAGDDVLIEIARRIQSALRASDTLGRLSGDEFIVICNDAGNSHDVEMLAERILASVRVPVEIEGRLIGLQASIGIAVTTPREHGVTQGADLIRTADAAMYQAKRRGGGHVVLVNVA